MADPVIRTSPSFLFPLDRVKWRPGAISPNGSLTKTVAPKVGNHLTYTDIYDRISINKVSDPDADLS